MFSGFQTHTRKSKCKRGDILESIPSTEKSIPNTEKHP